MASTTVNFNLKTAGYVNYANQTLTFRLLTAGAEASTGDQSYVTLPGVVTATSAANGDGSVVLYRNGKSGIDSIYEVILPNREKAKFLIPSGSATIELAALLVDHVPGGSNAQQSSVYAEAIKRANHTGNLTLDGLASGAITGTLAVANGGTNASSASEARTSLGAQEQKDVLDDLGALSAPASDGQFIVATGAGAFQYETAATARTSLGLGTIATQASNSVNIDGGAIDATVIGASTAAAGTFSALTAPTTNLNPIGDKKFITADQNTKLNAIDPDVTTLDLPASTTINAFAKDSLLNSNAADIKVAIGAEDYKFVPRSITFTDENSFLSVANGTGGELDVGTGDFSFSFAARVSSNSNAPVLQKNGSAGYAIFFDTGTLKLTLNSGGSENFELATGLNDNKWHTYVITVDRSDTAIAYVDGVAKTGESVSGKAGNLDNDSDLQIGYVGTIVGSGIALGNYVSLHKTELDSTAASNIYFSPDTALGAGSTALMVDLRKADKTFTDVSTNGIAVTTNGTIIFNEGRITSLDGATVGATTPAAVTGTNVLATTTLGYTAGSGGTVPQGDTSGKGTAVALNKISGEIVMDDASLANDATAVFTFNNTTIAATDVVIVNIASGVAVAGSYQVTVGAVAANSCSISVLNVSGDARTDTIKLNFAVIKAVKT